MSEEGGHSSSAITSYRAHVVLFTTLNPSYTLVYAPPLCADVEQPIETRSFRSIRPSRIIPQFLRSESGCGIALIPASRPIPVLWHVVDRIQLGSLSPSLQRSGNQRQRLPKLSRAMCICHSADGLAESVPGGAVSTDKKPADYRLPTEVYPKVRPPRNV